jgi:DNA-binding NarL/FixJ family response regulator
MEQTRIGVLLVRNETVLFTDALAKAMDSDPSVRLISKPLSLDEALELCKEQRPEVVLLEASEMSSVRTLSQACDEAPVILLADSEVDDSFLVAGMEAGASGIVDGTARIGEVVGAVEAVAAGHRVVDQDRFVTAVGETARLREWERKRTELLGLLSEREREILAELDRGLRNSDIAERLRISPRTVEKHVHNILAKLQVSSRLAAVALARERGDPAYKPMRGTA